MSSSFVGIHIMVWTYKEKYPYVCVIWTMIVKSFSIQCLDNSLFF